MASIGRRSLVKGALLAGPAALITGAAPALGAPPIDPVGRNHGAPITKTVQTVGYIEVNDNSMLNLTHYVLDDDQPVFDMGMVFAANINWDSEAKRPVLFLNENVQRVLDNAKTEIRPLQKMGIKVCLTVLGNHHPVGLANLADRAMAEDFADQIAAVVEKYGLDGVDFDDEWSKYPSAGEKVDGVLGAPNAWSFPYLLDALRQRMPDKLLTFYYIGPVTRSLVYGDLKLAELLDYSWQPYYGSYRQWPLPGQPNSRFGAAAIDLSSSIATSYLTSFAERTMKDGYGIYLTYQLQPGDQSAKLSAITEPLYGSKARYIADPKHGGGRYKKR